jgi:N-acetylglutamate synthase-like GNAT family acetyltransferase
MAPFPWSLDLPGDQGAVQREDGSRLTLRGLTGKSRPFELAGAFIERMIAHALIRMSHAPNNPIAELAAAIRQANAADAASVESLYHELVSDPLVRVLPEQVNALGASPTSFLLVAEVDGAVCATALLTLCPDAMYRTQPFGVIENIIVAQAMRQRGIGRRLLVHIERLARTHDCTKLMLLSGATRAAAHAFFRRCGFASDTKHAFVKYRSQWDNERMKDEG